jgi:PIN domain nuclease of toxin-antitoxin system
LRLLLDTHLLLWALAEPRKIPRDARAMIERSEVFVSPASIWEISIKAATGKLKAKPADVLRAVEPAGFAWLVIQAEHAARVFDLGPHHLDPFDRLLIAQAELEHLVLLTNDEALAAYGKHVRVV